MEFRSFLKRYLAGKPVVARPNVGYFLWLHLHISLNTPCFHPPSPTLPPPPKKIFLHNLCFLFLMGISVVSGLIEDKAPTHPLNVFWTLLFPHSVPVHTNTFPFENAYISMRLCLPSTLIRQKRIDLKTLLRGDQNKTCISN